MTRPDSIVQRPQTCHCGHDVATHYHDTAGSGVCLAQCECLRFIDRDAPDSVRRLPPRPAPRPRRTTWPL